MFRRRKYFVCWKVLFGVTYGRSDSPARKDIAMSRVKAMNDRHLGTHYWIEPDGPLIDWKYFPSFIDKHADKIAAGLILFAIMFLLVMTFYLTAGR